VYSTVRIAVVFKPQQQLWKIHKRHLCRYIFSSGITSST